MGDGLGASVVLNDMNRTREAAYGFRSWVLQDIGEPYEVVLNLFNDRAGLFEGLVVGQNPNCHCRIHTYSPPQFFNIAAANNLGLAQAGAEYVLFANSDIIYPSNYLRILLGEVRRRDLSYLLGYRVNLGHEETLALGQAAGIASFDFLAETGERPGRSYWGPCSPWTIRREVAMQIGGFDARVVCHEDTDLNDRVMHYLRRNQRQVVLYAAPDLVGYHLHHSSSELYLETDRSRAIVEPRRARLKSCPTSEEDVVATGLDDMAQLLKDLYETPAPPIRAHLRRVVRSVARRGFGALNYALHGTLK